MGKSLKSYLSVFKLVFFLFLSFQIFGEDIPKETELSEKDILTAKLQQEAVGRNIINALRYGKFALAEFEWKKIENSNLQEAEYHYLKGSLFYSRLEWNDAKANLTKSLTLNPKHEAASFLLGMTYAQEDNWVKAKDVWVDALDLSPYNPFYYYNIGVAHFVLGDWSKAIDVLKKAEEYKPNYAEARMLLAQCYVENGNLDLSKTILESILELEPRNEKAHNLLGRVIYQINRDSKKALVHLKNERTLGWRERKVYGRSFFEMRNWKRAESIFRYVAFSPFADESDEVLYLNILLNLGWEEKANEYFRFAETKVKNSSVIGNAYRSLLVSHEGKTLLYHYFKTR